MSALWALWAKLWAWALPARFAQEQERAYSLARNHQLLPVRRVASLVATLVWCSYIPRDVMLAAAEPTYAAVMDELLLIRFLVVGVFLLTHGHFFTSQRVLNEPGYGDKVIMVSSGAVFLGLSAIVVLLPYPYDQLYGVIGLALVIAATYGLFGLSMRSALVLAHWHLALIGFTLWWCSTHKLAPDSSMAAQQFFHNAALLMSTFVGVGCTVCWLQEVHARRSFLDQQMLAQQNESIRLHGLALQQLNEALALSSTQAQERLQAIIRLKERLHQEAEARNHERAQIMASAVHDLRQPVQAIMAAMYPVSRALERGDQATVSHLLQLSHQATHFLQDQLTGMLEIARLESGRVQPDVGWLDLRHLAQETVSAFSAQAQSDGVHLSLTLPDDACWIRSDAQFLRRIVGNLISNGIKYRRTDAEGGAWVQVILNCEAQQAQVQVKDNGLGIAPNLLGQGLIFQPFFQANNLLAQAEKGVGLGLAVVQKLLALLSGHTLEVQSQLGIGTCFVLGLPHAAAGLEAGAIRLPDDLDHSLLSGLYVLLVEDDVIVRESMQHMLQVVGVLCEPFESFEALASAAEGLERRPDVLISDYRLPAGRTALDVRRLQQATWPQVPMVVLSGEPLDTETQPELQGLTLFRKPAAVEDLLRTLITLAHLNRAATVPS